eukprot:g8708.t1
MRIGSFDQKVHSATYQSNEYRYYIPNNFRQIFNVNEATMKIVYMFFSVYILILQICMFINIVRGNTCNPGQCILYSIRGSGICDSPITTENECKAAAALNGFTYGTAISNTNYTYGCFHFSDNDKYYFQSSASSTKECGSTDGNGNTAKCICKQCASCPTGPIEYVQPKVCDHEHCQWCDDGVCKQCRHNLHLYNGTCVIECPDGYIAERPNWVRNFGRMIGRRCRQVFKNAFIVPWGHSSYGAAVPSHVQRINVKSIVSTLMAFAVIRLDGDVSSSVGPISNSQSPLSQSNGPNGPNGQTNETGAYGHIEDVEQTVWGHSESWEALKVGGQSGVSSLGNLAVWGEPAAGGLIQSEIDYSDIVEIFSNTAAFAALHANGLVEVWGTCPLNKCPRLSGVKTIFASPCGFAALLEDNTIFAWGSLPVTYNAGQMYAAAQLCLSDNVLKYEPSAPGNGNISTVFSNAGAFVALKFNGCLGGII